jgi:cobyrinic acid a,c-diamide synthase
MSIPTLVIGGTHSGVGKTSVAIGLMRALANRGMQVQPFKVGPDFIDPGHHQRATGRVSHNLDGWMLSPSQNREIFARACQGADLAIVEGVMGLFDGYGADSEAGSTAELAKWLGAPVILVINARALGRSAAALIAGYTGFDPDLAIAGVICNQVGSASHLDRIQTAVAKTLQIPILGGLPRTEQVSIPQRHLGLWRATEDDLTHTDYIESLARLIAANIDLDALVKIAQLALSKMPPSAKLDCQPGSRELAGATPTSESHPLACSELPAKPSPPSNPELRDEAIGKGSSPVRIGVAQDQAFCFYYAINLTLLEQAGAALVPFSPLRDSLPENLDGLYLGGGYPELYAEPLSENQALCEQIAAFCRSGHPVYGECGGLMYLSQGLLGADQQAYPFVGILPFWTQMGQRVKLGYRQVEVTGANSCFPHHGTIRGHRFHYSDIVDAAGNRLDLKPDPADLLTTEDSAFTVPGLAAGASTDCNQPLQFNYRLQGWGDYQGWEGYQVHNVLASYVHLHFGSNPAFSQRFVQCCRYRQTMR